MKRIVLLLVLPVMLALSVDSEFIRKQPTAKNDSIDAILNQMTLEQKIGQFFMVAAYSNRDEEHMQELKDLVKNKHIGGLIFFQGDALKMDTMITELQNESSIPLLIGMDAEWGTSMRLYGEERFPYQYTMGAANNPKLTMKISQMIAADCLEKGIHINFAPVADVNSNPENPVIGFRSFGANPDLVASQTAAFVKGHEEQGILSCLKHFPGHGDTHLDSHKDLPIIENSLAYIDSVDLVPFRAGIEQKASAVMIAHLSVPAMDSTGIPSTLSSKIINEELKQKLNYRGLIISDALNMRAVADRYGKAEVAVKAFLAGCDILLFPENVEDAVRVIAEKVRSGEIMESEIDARVRKILKVKEEVISDNENWKHFSDEEVAETKKLLYEQAITVLKNDDALPIKRLDQRIACIALGADTEVLIRSIQLIGDVDFYHAYSGDEAIERYSTIVQDYDVVITSLHANSVRARKDYGYPTSWREWIKQVPNSKKHILLFAGNPQVLEKDDASLYADAIVTCYENHPLALDRLGQFVMGATEAKGKLPMTINEKWSTGYGVLIPWAGRLKYSSPYEFGIDPHKFAMIDSLVNKSIRNGVFPGCQIVIAYDGSIIYRKGFGYQTYDSIISIDNDAIYDLASVTKIASSTVSLMKLESEGKFTLDSKLGDYLPELTDSTSYYSLNIKSMLAHQAGLHSWIPFYTSTLTDGIPNESIYKTSKQGPFTSRVTDDLWMDSNYVEIMYDRILNQKLSGNSYKYSDLGYYFLKRVIEKQTNQPLDVYVLNSIYKPLGLRTMGYNPIDRFGLERIPPTEDDKTFRHELIHGYVHDQGAAMMGGVGGHAGLFSNATDLAGMMQLFLNKGQVAGINYISAEIIDKYTTCQYSPSNRRGAGFDKPVKSLQGGPTCSLVSLSSYGHSGFTGTYAWADPEYKVNYVFLSNRVYPDAENWKIVKTGVRTDIQRMIYEILREAERL